MSVVVKEVIAEGIDYWSPPLKKHRYQWSSIERRAYVDNGTASGILMQEIRERERTYSGILAQKEASKESDYNEQPPQDMDEAHEEALQDNEEQSEGMPRRKFRTIKRIEDLIYDDTAVKQGELEDEAYELLNADGFYDEILPVELKDRKGNVTVFDTDEGPRASQTIEKLAKLRPCFVDGGTVTAGNSSSLNDGAAAVVVMSADKAKELGVVPKLKVEGFAVAGFDADLMGYSPKFSSEKLAAKLGLDLTKIDMFEINEAFASQAFAVARDLNLDMDKVNIYGGGISIGHPLGATGAILTVKVLYELLRTDKKDAMISMCIGGGQGMSMYFTKCE